MSEAITNTLVGACLALAGVTLANLISIVRDKYKRKWELEDIRKNRRTEILERRCNQIEEYIEAVTQNARQVMHDVQFYLGEDDIAEANIRMKNMTKQKDNLDTRIFARGPAILSLGDERLYQIWNELIEVFEQMQGLLIEVFDRKFELNQLLDVNAFAYRLDELWSLYSHKVADFYQRIDIIREKTVE